MRLIPWITPFVLAVAMLAAASLVNADEHEHEILDDQALEETYGIKAGAVKRDDDSRSSDRTGNSGDSNVAQQQRAPDAGTGGSGSSEVTRGESSSEKSMEE